MPAARAAARGLVPAIRCDVRTLLLLMLVACGPTNKDPSPPPSPPPDASLRAHPGDPSLKHLELDDSDGGVAPINHHELLWGDYIDKRGNPAVGWHSHDPAIGNAQ